MASRSPGNHLNGNEINIMTQMIKEGHSNKEIANKVHVSTTTVARWKRTQHTWDDALPLASTHQVPIVSPLRQQTAEEAVIQVYVESTDYPEIKALITRQQRYRVMAQEAERLGDDELQLLLLTRMDTSPLEKEILRYWAEQHSKDN